MKNKDFLNKIRKEGLLDLVEPSEEIKNSYIKKSESNLISAKILLKNNHLEEAVSLIYYSMYNVLLALLYKTGIKSENHSASIIVLKEVFNFDNLAISSAKKQRISTQYYVDFEIVKDNVTDLIKRAEEFNSRLLDFISKLNNEQIKSYRRKFVELLNI